ncbi:MAG TPA: glycoside hydrolase family 172 protein, partial [Cyclobacteriaceae bacterium]|nr:glycoside hydrolase family 172 protein [Cyclobacteriaceae bacterium]
EKEKDLLKNAAEIWKMDKEEINNKIKNDNPEIETTEDSFTLNPGESHEIFSSSLGGRIVKFEVGPTEAFAGNGKDFIIEARWDGEESLAINCPLSDFFGYAFGKPSMRSMLIGSDDHMNYSFIPMPFDTKAWIRLVYVKRDGEQKPLELTSSVWLSNIKRNEDKEGKLYAVWRRENPVKDRESHVFLNETGRGHLIGAILQAQGLKAGMTQFFEGDDSTAVDGTMRIHGTGSEDYFNGGWYALPDRWDRAFSLPVHGSLDYSIPFARTGGYRFYIGDKISFEKNIFHSIEHGPVGNRYPADYTSVAFYYGEKAPENFSVPGIENTVLFRPDTFVLTPDLLKITPGLFTNVEYPDWGLAVFSCTQMGIVRISLDELPQGRFQVYMTYFNQPAGARFSLWQRQQQRSAIFNAKAEKEELVNDEFLGEISLDDFYTTMSFLMEPTMPTTYLKIRGFKFIKIKD